MSTGKTKIKDSFNRGKKFKTKIMGIINLTPDSFSGDGLLAEKKNFDSIIRYAQCLVSQGADIIDIGGESTRPGAKRVSIKDEISRTIPVIEKLVKKIKTPISIDTYKPQVAQCALESGASIVNDITGLKNPGMIKVVAKHKAEVIIMHMKGMPSNMQKNPKYKSLIEDITQYLQVSINKALDAGIDAKKIIIDPGIGFGKTVEHNLEILNRLEEFKKIGFPILIGTSRKSFIGKVLDLPPQERLIGTVSSLVIAVIKGADIIRVHDVKFAAQAVKMTEAVLYPDLYKKKW